MTTKIFGAVLIVSGGYLLGRIPVYYNSKRRKTLNEIYGIFRKYQHDLIEFRAPLQESLKKQGEFAAALSEGVIPNTVFNEDRVLLKKVMNQLKNCSYKESVECINSYLDTLKKTVEALKNSEETTGKALPLVAGMIGLLVAVLLF